MGQYFFAWLASPPELAASVLVATGLGAITAKLAVAKAPFVNHQIAEPHQAPPATTATRVATTRTWLLPFRQMRRQQVLLWSIAWRTGSLRSEMQSNWREVCERLDQ